MQSILFNLIRKLFSVKLILEKYTRKILGTKIKVTISVESQTVNQIVNKNYRIIRLYLKCPEFQHI